MSLAILADLGGTNTRVALADGATVLVDSIRKYRNADYKARGQDISDILRDFLEKCGAKVGGVCVAAAGPVQDGIARMTNLDWTMDAKTLATASGAQHVAILNDLQAQGHALGHIPADRLRQVITGPELGAAGPMLVVGLGTGVNAAPVHGIGAGRVVPPSECGHVNIPVRDAEGLALMRFIEAQLAAKGEVAHCGVEELLAGRGLANLFAFAADRAGDAARPDSAEVLARLAQNDALATEAARLYTRILGQFLADQALIHLPWNGIYLIGGMARAMSPHFARFGLTAAFREPRRVDLLTRDFSVRIVEDDYAALTGCAAWLAAKPK